MGVEAGQDLQVHLLLCSAGLGALPTWSSALARSAPTIAFVDVAAQPMGSPQFLDTCRSELRRAGCELVDVNLLTDTPSAIERCVGRSDGVFVTGGYPIYLLEWARRSGFLDVVSSAVRSGSLGYCGVSAGAALAGPSMEPLAASDDPGEVDDYAALGLVDVVVIPHANRHPPGLLRERQRSFAPRLDLRPLADDRAFLLVDSQLREVDSIE